MGPQNSDEDMDIDDYFVSVDDYRKLPRSSRSYCPAEIRRQKRRQRRKNYREQKAKSKFSSGVESARDDNQLESSAQAVVINEDPQLEIIFLLDTSSDVSLLSFMDQMTFVDTMTDCFATYMEPRMSVMSYGDEVMKLQGLDDDPNWSHDDPSVGGDRNTDGALAMALEEFEQYGVDGADKLILLFSFGAPMANHEPCLDDYVSPTLQKLRDMGVVVTTHGINLSSEVMNNLKCMVSASDDLDEEDQEDHLTNTESATALADQWGYTACAYGEEEENE